MLSMKRLTILVALAAFVAAGAAVATAKKPPSGFKTTTKAIPRRRARHRLHDRAAAHGGRPRARDRIAERATTRWSASRTASAPSAATHGVTRVFMNHELNKDVESHPYADRAEHQRGAFISEYRLARDGSVLSGRRAFDTVYQDDTLVGSGRGHDQRDSRIQPLLLRLHGRAARRASTARST